jgi:hypothetical protein
VDNDFRLALTKGASMKFAIAGLLLCAAFALPATAGPDTIIFSWGE